jgi:hypothetical protein
VETLQQVKENNTTFTFWLLPRRIPVAFGKKMRESKRLSLSGCRLSARERVTCTNELTEAGSRKAEADLHALYAQKSDRAQNGP